MPMSQYLWQTFFDAKIPKLKWCIWPFLYSHALTKVCVKDIGSKASMVLQNYQNFTEMTSTIIYIVAFGIGLKCPREINLIIWFCYRIIRQVTSVLTNNGRIFNADLLQQIRSQVVYHLFNEIQTWFLYRSDHSGLVGATK